MPLTQDNRQIAIETPLGKDVLLLQSATVTEQLGRLFQIEVELLSEKHDVAFDDLVGQNVTLRLNLAGEAKRYFNGFVSRFIQNRDDGNFARYRAVIVPWPWFLTRTSDCRIFQNMTVPDIVEKVFKDAGFSDYENRLTEAYPTWEYCVQYRETDFNFVSRLMEQEGIYYFFVHENGKHTLILADAYSAHEAYPEYSEVVYRPPSDSSPGRECITDWVMEKSVQPGAYALNDFNFETVNVSLLRVSNVSRSHAEADHEIYDYPGEYEEGGEGERYSKMRVEELQARHEVLHAQASAKGMAQGHLFTMADHPRDDQNREYLIVGVSLQMDAGKFEAGGGGESGGFFSCSCTAIDAQTPFRSERTTPKPLIQGPQTALVVGPSGEEIHTDEHGRVKVQFHWDREGQQDENSSCWIRVSQPWTGKGWGSLALPRIGQEVIVEFLEGDPDRPIITGRVYNAESTPPYELPAEKTKSTLKTNSSKGGGGFNEIRLEDKKGEEEFFLHAEKDHEIRIKNDVHEWVGNDRHLIVTNDQVEKVENNRSESVVGEHKEEIGKDRHLKVAGLEAKSVDGTLSLTVKGDVAESFKANHAEEVTQNFYLKANGTVILESSQGVTLKCGGSSVVVDNTGVTIKGSMVTVDGSMVKIASGPGSPAGSGTAGSPETPAAPDAPVEAAVADPGESAQIESERAEQQGRSRDSVQVGAAGAGDEEAEEDETSWISFELKDEDGQPMADEPYKIKLPDGTIREGRLDGEGKARVAGFKNGQCEICFPRIDGEEWRPA